MPTRLNDLETLYGADGYRHIIFLHSFFWLRLAAEELSRNSFPVFPSLVPPGFSSLLAAPD
ncbi:hypothetical protein LF1_03990 [Rubripirellula obstinata]|uniref:Uncharacterized protein n=1 Tax=Rubripirellula obstinata TaxID=406547 RepID=A0A5B1CDQ9_9BACT|nr:hypothetical protein LF1_03990 [Rubripirellula obstinata]